MSDLILCLNGKIEQLQAVNTELLAELKMAVRYLEHPDVLAVTEKMALPGGLLVKRLYITIEKLERRTV